MGAHIPTCTRQDNLGVCPCDGCTNYNLASDVQPIQWISCKDNMPETLGHGLSTMYSDCCLVCDAFGWVGMAYYITDGQKSWWEFADAQNKNKIDWTEVTHWMPLPEPPEGGDAE